MKFGAPSFLYGLTLIPLLVAFLMWGWRQREKALARFVDADLGKRLVTEISPSRRKWKNVLLVGSAALALFSLARPQWGYRWEEVTRRGVDIMIAVDVSKSMLAGDVSPSRLERAKRKVEDLLNLLQGDRVGLIAFSGRAFVMTPLTLDYGAIRLFLDSLSPELITAQGTNVGEAVDLAMKALKKGSPESQSLLLMTDGEDLSGDALDAAKKAAEQGVRLYALGIGTESGAPIPVPGGGFKKDQSGQIVLTRLDESALQKMTAMTGGVYVRSVADDRDLQALYGAMRGKLEEKELKAGKQRHYIDRYQFFLALALLLLIAEALMSETKAGGWFRRRAAAMVLVGVFLAPVFGVRPANALNLPGTIQEGERLYKAGKYDEALQKFLSAQIDHPNDPRLQYNLGNTYYQLKRYEDAQKLFDAVAKSPSKSAGIQEQSLYNRGNAQFRGDHLEDAISSYEDALKIDPKDEDARYNLELAKKKLEEKKQQQQQQQNQNKDQNQRQQKQNEQQQPQQGNEDQKNQQGQQNQDQSQQQQSQQNQQQNRPQSDQQKQQTGQSSPNEQQNNQQQPQSGEQQSGERNKEEQKNAEQRQQPQNPQGENQKQNEQPQRGQQPASGRMSQDEAARWLSTLQEGRRVIIPKGGKSKSETRGKDW